MCNDAHKMFNVQVEVGAIQEDIVAPIRRQHAQVKRALVILVLAKNQEHIGVQIFDI